MKTNRHVSGPTVQTGIVQGSATFPALTNLAEEKLPSEPGLWRRARSQEDGFVYHLGNLKRFFQRAKALDSERPALALASLINPRVGSLISPWVGSWLPPVWWGKTEQGSPGQRGQVDKSMVGGWGSSSVS